MLQEPAMKKLLSPLMAAILAVSFALPLNAAPMFVPKTEQARVDAVEHVKHRRHWRHKHYSHWREHRHWKRRHALRHCRYYGDCYPRYSHYGRYYGYRDYYPRHRRRPGFSIYLEF
jgi:hypothetical protein